MAAGVALGKYPSLEVPLMPTFGTDSVVPFEDRRMFEVNGVMKCRVDSGCGMCHPEPYCE